MLERGSVEGEVFHRGGVAALVQDETPVDGRLVALVRKTSFVPRPRSGWRAKTVTASATS